MMINDIPNSERAKEIVGKLSLYEIINFRNALDRESDRGCVLLAAAYIEERLEVLLKSVFVNDNKIMDSIFCGYGPLGTFSAKAYIAYSLGLIGKDVLKCITLIRKIRNEFAHSFSLIDFSDKRISAKCAELHSGFWQEKLPTRQTYIRCALIVLGAIDASIINARPLEKKENIDKDDFLQKHPVMQREFINLLSKIVQDADNSKQ